MLIDEITIYAQAGKGGDGVVRWRHEKFIPRGGPAGGDGGRGGDVYLKAVRDVGVLHNYLKKKDFYAENGENGAGKSLEGKNGEDLFIEVPVGTIATNKETGDVYKLDIEGQEVLILRGGRGGLGNEHFKSSTNTTPTESTPGRDGQEGYFFIEVELTADAGLIGLPSAGKSSLLNTLTRASSKVGDYPFTTLEPALGVFYGYVLADIPGLIEGASQGRGLGHKFLRHIRRTRALIHLVSFEYEDMVSEYKKIREELGKFDEKLLEKEEIIVLSKSDLVDQERVDMEVDNFKKIGKDVLVLSILDDNLIKEFSSKLSQILKKD